MILGEDMLIKMSASFDIPPEFGSLEKYSATLGHKGIIKQGQEIEMFYLNTIEQLFLFVEQSDQLEVCLPYSNWNSNTSGTPKFKLEFK